MVRARTRAPSDPWDSYYRCVHPFLRPPPSLNSNACTGCPNYLHLISGRAQKSGIAFEPPYIPVSFLSCVHTHDPAYTPYTKADASNPFAGKKVLVLSGADDQVVPWESSDEFVKNLEVGSSGVKKVIVYPGVGHACTDAMVKDASDFVWEQVLSKVQ